MRSRDEGYATPRSRASVAGDRAARHGAQRGAALMPATLHPRNFASKSLQTRAPGAVESDSAPLKIVRLTSL
ncbi:unnamed protein product [Euphydryas editha]|uniref:Uncharacterized protein n=1 Tax=Euphydryas editha TaxID=104508 RepID=A0AAU9UI05_EUPED|nr:unnamed protein product [Euphydryas editha]